MPKPTHSFSDSQHDALMEMTDISVADLLEAIAGIRERDAEDTQAAQEDATTKAMFKREAEVIRRTAQELRDGGSADHCVHLQPEGGPVHLVLPDGQMVGIELSHQEEGTLPELDIWFKSDEAVNCWQENMMPAKPLSNSLQHVRLARQLVIPIDCLPKEK